MQSRTPQLLKNGRLSGQLRQKYRHDNNQGSINRSSQEELVPMINATQFDDESEGNYLFLNFINTSINILNYFQLFWIPTKLVLLY